MPSKLWPLVLLAAASANAAAPEPEVRHLLDFISASEGVIDTAHHRRYGIVGVQ